MTDDTESLGSFEQENPKYVLKVLEEYHIQSAEDCRVIENQKNILIPFTIALGTFIYALAQVYSAIAPNIWTLLSNTWSISLSTIIIITLTLIIIIMVAMATFLIITLFYSILSSLIFLTFHLDLMNRNSIRIEELQRDILFKKMGNIDLFSWNEIIENEISRNENPLLFGIKKETFKEYLKQKFILENITTIITNANNEQIQINITEVLPFSAIFLYFQ